MKAISCNQFEELLADYIDAALNTEDRSACEAHQAQCAACASLAQDAQSAVSFLATVEAPIAPPWVAEKILRNTIYAPGPFARFMAAMGLARVWAPRWIIGLSMAAMSFVMISRVWSTTENRVFRVWDRTIKNYENLELVSSVRNQWEDWSEERLTNQNMSDQSTFDRGRIPRKESAR